MTESRGTVIAHFSDEAEAHMAAATLEAEDIDVVVIDTLPRRALGRRKAALAVAEVDVGRAVNVLKTTPARASLLPQHGQSGPGGA